MMRIVVTGVAGCLGRYVASDLARRGFDVVGIYRNRKPTLSHDMSLQLIACDLTDTTILPDRYDAVFHAAAVSPAPGISIADMARDNVEATRQLVEHSRRAAASHFVFCSSLSIYGTIMGDYVDETTPISDPGTYGLTKLIGESLVAEAAPKMSILSLRLPAVLGPGASRNFLAITAEKLKAERQSQSLIQTPISTMPSIVQTSPHWWLPQSTNPGASPPRLSSARADR